MFSIVMLLTSADITDKKVYALCDNENVGILLFSGLCVLNVVNDYNYFFRLLMRF
jgi:hypothetical protein